MIFGIARACRLHLVFGNSVVGEHRPHKFCQPSNLDSAVGVDREAMAMQSDFAILERDVALNKTQMNVQFVRISGENLVQ